MAKVKILTVFIMLIMALASRAEDIRTMFHRGHQVKDFVISYDERYVLTRSESEVCVWDLNSRMLVATLPLYTSEIFAHPTDSRLFYADTKHFGSESIRDSSLDANDLYDWTTGKRIGRVSREKMPKYSAGSDFTFVRDGDMLLMLTALGSDVTQAGTIGGYNRSAGAARSCCNDSLLLTSGKNPLLWDLRHAALIGAAPQSMVDGDPIIAVSPEHISKSQGDRSFREMPSFRRAAKGRMFTAVSRTYGNGNFLVGSDNTAVERTGDSGVSLMEGNIGSDTPLRFATNRYDKIRDIKISPHDDYAVITSAYRDVALLSLVSLQYTASLTADYDDLEMVTKCEILPDETVVAGTTTGKLNFWRKGEAESRRHSNVHRAEICSITLSADSARMFTSDKAGLITIWDVKTLEPIVYVYQVADDDGADYIFLTPDHYYQGTPGIGRHINFVKDGLPYAFEQFDLRNNRPDIVLSRLGGDPAEIELLNRAWKKRLRRAGVSEESLSADYHVPTTVINRKEIPFITDRGSIALNVDFSDSKYELSEVHVTVNGVPVLNPDQRRVNGCRHNLKETVALASGNNEISVWCSNIKGASSLRETINVTYSPEDAVKPDLYVVSAGVSHYADSRYNLGYAAKDAGDFAETMKQRTAGHFGRVKTLSLTDAEVTKANLEKIHTFLGESRPDDVALVFFAGHGVLDSELDYYLGGYDMDFSNPGNGGIAYDDFIGVFDGVPALNRVCFIDACHSGELDKEDYMAVNTVAMPEGEELLFRSAGQNVQAWADVERVNTIIGDMFRDIRRGVGATVLSSAGGGELAVESPEWNNGLFTYCLLKGIRSNDADADGNGTISLNEWINYTRRKVSDMSEGRQSPTLRSQNYHNDLEIK